MVLHKDVTQMGFNSLWETLAWPGENCLLLQDWFTTSQIESPLSVPTLLSSGSHASVCIWSIVCFSGQWVMKKGSFVCAGRPRYCTSEEIHYRWFWKGWSSNTHVMNSTCPGNAPVQPARGWWPWGGAARTHRPERATHCLWDVQVRVASVATQHTAANDKPAQW